MRLFFKLILFFAVVSVLGFVGWFIFNFVFILGNLLNPLSVFAWCVVVFGEYGQRSFGFV